MIHTYYDGNWCYFKVLDEENQNVSVALAKIYGLEIKNGAIWCFRGDKDKIMNILRGTSYCRNLYQYSR